MTLLAKTTLLYLIVALLVFGLAGVVTYDMVKKEVEKETDYYLNGTFKQLRNAIEAGKPPNAYANDWTRICQLDDGIEIRDTTPVYTDTLANHMILDRLEPHRKLSRITKINGQYYYVILMDVLIESDDVYEGVFNILSRLFIFLSAAIILFSFIISRYFLQPFYDTLHKINHFNLKDNHQLTFSKTSTKEFRQLNNFINKMTGKARKDYVALKEFNENASHEMQTPIAVAKGKLELLIQSENLTEEQINLIGGAHESISKISKIGQSLTLLSKIDNEEFIGLKEINYSLLVKRTIENFKELASLKGLAFEQHIEDNIYLKVDATLSEILVSNLLKNAIQHNVPNGKIKVELSEKRLEVFNTGKPAHINPDRLFERFRKGNQSGGSLGLGLAIVKKVCDVNDWKVKYRYQNQFHRLSVLFA